MKGIVFIKTSAAIKCAVILCITSILAYSCTRLKRRHEWDISEWYLKYYLEAYWASDSLSNNGFRSLASYEMLRNRKNIIGSDAKILLGILGVPKEKVEAGHKTIFIYLVDDAPVRGNDTYLHVIIDRDEQTILKIFRRNDEY